MRHSSGKLIIKTGIKLEGVFATYTATGQEMDEEIKEIPNASLNKRIKIRKR